MKSERVWNGSFRNGRNSTTAIENSDIGSDVASIVKIQYVFEMVVELLMYVLGGRSILYTLDCNLIVFQKIMKHFKKNSIIRNHLILGSVKIERTLEIIM